MNRLTDDEIGDMWSRNYPRRSDKYHRLLLSALVNIIKGNSFIIASKDDGNYLKTLTASLQQCNVPADEFSEIEQSEIPS
jgi:hypothetical protein